MKTVTSPRSTIHVEVILTRRPCAADVLEQIRAIILRCLDEFYVSVRVGEVLSGYDVSEHNRMIERAVVTDYIGPQTSATYHAIAESQVDIQIYSLHAEQDADPRKRARLLGASEESETVQVRILRLPSIVLKNDWESLVFDDALPTKVLRMLVRMLDIMRQPGLNSHTFNWNRLCLLHGPPGSGKSTLCRALVQKLSIRLGRIFSDAIVFEINCNTMLSRYFGQSGKLIDSLFQRIAAASQSAETLVCVVMDEIETIASHRKNISDHVDCRDGLRATNQLLTALDHLRTLPNVIVLCTSNLVSELDSAFLDRVDKKILVPSLSPTAIYAIFRSCFNELIQNDVIDVNQPTAGGSTCTVPSFTEMTFLCHDDPESPGRRLWQAAQSCKGFSGRSLRRLPILALAENTRDKCTLDEAITALNVAIQAELTNRVAKTSFS